MRTSRILWIGVPAIFIFAAVVVLFGPGPKPQPIVRVRSIAVRANRSDPDDVARARQKIKEIYQAIEEGEDFKKLARERSESDNYRQDGDMGWRGRGTLPPHHEDAVFDLEAGQHSEIIEDITLEHIIYRILYVEERKNF